MSTQEMLLNRRRAVKVLLKRVYNVLLDEVEDLVELEMDPEKAKLREAENAEKKNFQVAYVPVVQEPVPEYIAEYRMLLRMTPDVFDRLLALVLPKIQKLGTVLREPISPSVMLEVTLNFLATGSSYHTQQCCFRVSKAAISNFVPNVCDAIIESLQEFITVSLIILSLINSLKGYV